MSLAMIQLFKSIEATPTQRLVAYMLADAHNEQTGRCDLSVASLAGLTSLGERTIQDALKALELAGHLSRVFRTGTSTQYTLTPRSSRAPADTAPPQISHPSPAAAAPPPPQMPHPTPAAAAPYPERTGILTGSEPEVPEGAGKPPPVVVKVKTSKPDWREFNQANADKANAVPLPEDASRDFQTAWQRWREYRTGKAVDARIASEALAWTQTAAEAGIRDCQRAAAVHGWPAVIARMDQAMQGWQGFNFDRMQPARQNAFNGTRQPKHAAYNAKTATAGMTPDEILNF